MRKFQQYLYACGGLLTETTNALDVLRAEDLILLSHIVRAVSQSPPDVDDETEEAILRVPVSPEKDVEPWRTQAIRLLLHFVREATHEQAMAVTHLAGDLRGDRNPVKDREKIPYLSQDETGGGS